MNYGRAAVERRFSEVNSTPAKVGHKIGMTTCKVVLVALLLVCFVGTSAALGVVKGIIDSAPDISEIDVIPTGYSTTVLASDGTQIATLVASGANRKYVTIDEIPLYLQHAVVAIEDERFYEHNGIDLTGIARAIRTAITTGSFSEGASTITQQLIKNSVLADAWASESSLSESFQRKIQEQYLAVLLEAQVDDKDWILENYLNTINLGANTLGVQAAAERYFGKEVSELTLSECAVIAAITQNPSAYNPITYPENNATRRATVLEKMLEQGYITQEEYDEAMADDVYSRIAEHNVEETSTTTINSYFVDALIDDVYNDLINIKGYSETDAYKALYEGGLTIYSTQDLEIQAICDEEADDESNYANDTEYSFSLSFQVKKSDGTYKNYTHQTMLSYYKEVNNDSNYSINFDSEEECYEAIAQYESDVLEEGDEIVEGSESIVITLQPEVAMTVIDQSTGSVVALVGGRGEKSGNRTWNRATDTTRQPGSTFKIIACYAAALDAGDMTLLSTQYDARYTVGTKTYTNYDSVYRGETNIRTAITYSINVVTVKTLEEIGVDLGYQYAEEKFGISTLVDDDKNLGLSLGGLTYGTTNLELTAAYAAIANGGTYIEPTFYTKVLDHEGNVILSYESKETHQAVKESTAYLLTSAMEDVMTEGTGTAAYFGDTMAQAGKSGTTTSNRDSLFAGFTPYYTMVIWGGYDDNSKQSSTSYTKQIWHDVMERIHEDLEPIEEFEVPDSVVELTVCKSTGLLAGSGCSKVTEYFDAATAPDTTCTKHTSSSKKKTTTTTTTNTDSSSSGSDSSSSDSDDDEDDTPHYTTGGITAE